MIGGGLKKYAEAINLTVENGVAHGFSRGCYIAWSEGAGYKRLAIYIGCYHAPAEGAVQVEGETPAHLIPAQAVSDLILSRAAETDYKLGNEKRGLPAVMITQGGSVVLVNFFDNPGTMARIRSFSETVLPAVATMCRIHECEKCGQELADGTVPVLLRDEAVVPMHRHCAEKINSAITAAQQQEKEAMPILPCLGALIGALLGAVVWAAVGVAGYVVSLAGLLIAFLASKGYDLLGGKPGKKKLITLIICVVLAVVAGNLASEIYSLHAYYQEEVSGLPSWQIAMTEEEFLEEAIPLLWLDEEARAAVLGNVAMGLLFAALGCYGVLRTSAQKAGSENRVVILRGRR